MNHRQMVDLANVIHNIRPDWDQPGIVSQLSILNANWNGNDAQLTTRAISTASNPAAKTPGAINTKMPNAARQPKPRQDELEPNCYTCGRSKSECERMQDYEIEHGLPDPHGFETEADATNNARPLTPQQKTAIMAKIATTFRNVNEELAKP